jgi:hypothetical protein
MFQQFHRVHAMLWENYTSNWRPISVDWQMQPIKAGGGLSARTSHVAIDAIRQWRHSRLSKARASS